MINWLEILGWGSDQLEDLRFVGFSYIKQGQYDIALRFFEALDVLAENTYDQQTLGALYLQKGENLLALNTIEKALKLDPTHVPTLLNRAKAMLALGYKRQGITAAQSLAQNPDLNIANQASALILAYD
ncbi:MAG TPA: type III secretion chaperone [Rhabdochlamydiaceae bacterium]